MIPREIEQTSSVISILFQTTSDLIIIKTAWTQNRMFAIEVLEFRTICIIVLNSGDKIFEPRYVISNNVVF